VRIRLWLLSLSFLSLLAAQEPPLPLGVPSPAPQPEIKPEDQCTVAGIVLNSRTGQPVARAQVHLLRLDGGGPSSGAALTDPSGRFKLNGVAPGQYRAVASRNGFVRQVSQSGRTPPQLTLAPRQAVDGLTLELVPAAVIAGRVVDENGDPLPNVQLQPFRYVSVRGERHLVPFGAAVSTDDLGAYRMFGLNAGRYYISAFYSGKPGSTPGPGAPLMFGGPAPEAAAEAYPPLFYPGVAEPSQAAPIQLRAGDERRGVDLRLAPVRTIRIRGHIAPFAGRMQEAFVTLAPRGDWGVATFSMGPRPPARVDARGAFEFSGVTPGSHLLGAMLNREGGTLWARLPVEAGSADIDGLELAFRPNVDLKGRLRFDGGSQPGQDLTSVAVTLTPLQGSMGFAGSSRSALDAAGSFQIRNLAQGDYRLNIDPLPADAYILSAKYGEADVTMKPVSLGEVPETLEVVLSAAGARVQGMVTEDGNPAPGALVLVIPESGRADLRKVAQTDPNGRFTLRGLAPGGYTLYACQGGSEGSVPDPQDLEGFQNKAQKITVQEQGRVTADLTLIRTPDE